MSAGDHQSPGGLSFGIVGTSQVILDVVDLIRRFGPTEHTILVTGETGSGKELAARAIHTVSGRDAFTPVNCSAIAPDLIESEMFGHVRGAFTGADRARKGLFVAAGAGTLFLDEIGDLPLRLQPKLLRVLDQREFLPVGASSPQRLDARIIAATNRDLEQEIEERRFRGDLYWRLNDVQIHLPPLRDRPSDIPLLASHFAAETPIAENAISELKRYPRPGNVRQLANVVKVACVLAGDEPVRPEHLDGQIRAAGSPQPGSASKGVHREPAAPVTRQRYQRVGTEDAEKRMMADALEQARGNVTLAASSCGMARSTFNAKMREHRLSRSQFLNLKGSP